MSFINHSSQFCIISKLAELALCPIIQVVNEDILKVLGPVSIPGVHLGLVSGCTSCL